MDEERGGRERKEMSSPNLPTSLEFKDHDQRVRERLKEKQRAKRDKGSERERERGREKKTRLNRKNRHGKKEESNK